MKKRFVCFILSCAMIIGGLSGCGNSEQISKETDGDKTIEMETEMETETETEKETETETRTEKETETKTEIETETQSEVATENNNETDNHKHSYTEEYTKEPTCNEKGIITYTCACGDIYTEETSVMDHCTDRSEITKEATCEEEGIETFYCIFCGAEIYTEKIAKLPHTEGCNHATEDTITDPKNFTFTQYIKILYVTDTTGLYAFPDVNSNPYRYLEIGTAVPVISKCDQANFYRTPMGVTVSGENLSEVRPDEYLAGEEKGWENFIEETDSKYTYWTGIYRMDNYELHSEHMNKPYVERHLEYARQGLYILMYRDVDSKNWSGVYEIMVEEDGEFYSSEYVDWIVAYMEAEGINVSVKSEEGLLVYRTPKDDSSKKLKVISVSVGK